MKESQNYWIKLYNNLKFKSLCIDIETTEYDGPISVIGFYKPKDGVIECKQLIKDQDLTYENLSHELKGCEMIITFNGLKFDIQKIEKEFPNTIPKNIPIIDLYLFSRGLGINTNLKVLENTFDIDRLYSSTKKRGIAIKLWQKYKKENDLGALKELLEYNKQDTINLYFLAEALIKQAKKP